jgi:undecaprenyl-diphosphatase
MPAVIALGAGVVAGLLAAFVVRPFPALDPAAPRITSPAIAETAASTSPEVRGFLRRRLDPEATTGLLLTTALLIMLGAAVGIGALFVMVQHHLWLAHYDLTAANFGATNATTLSTRTLRTISLLGGTPLMIIVSVGVAIVEYVRTRSKAVFAFVFAVVVGELLLMNLTKFIVDRPRPNIAQLTGFSGSSFPSGHATTAAATFAAAAFLVGRGRPVGVKMLAAGIAAAIAVAVASSRVMLGVHWFTDVLAGLALGWGWFALCSIAFGGRILRFGRPVEVAERAADGPSDRPVAEQGARRSRSAW